MYYITNQNGQVIAASSDLLALLQVGSIDVLYKQIALDAIEFETDDKGITFKTPLYETHYKIEKETLSSLLGEMTLVRLTDAISVESNIGKEEELLFLEDEEEPLFEIKETAIDEKELAPKSEVEEKEEKEPLFEVKEASMEEETLAPEPEIEEKEEKESLFKVKEAAIDEETVAPEPEVKEKEEKEPLFDIKEASMEEEALAPEPEIEEKKEEAEDDLFDLILPTDAEKTIEEIKNKETLKKTIRPVYIDVEDISRSIGISPEDYNTFLTEYVDTALSLENDLKSDDKGKRTAATHTLFHLSNVLRLPVITDIIEQLKYTEDEDIDSSIQSFYDMLSRLTTTKPGIEEETKVSVSREESTSEHFKSFGTIDLSDVKPIHFDFQLEEAASELSLPAELIEEFIHDFIKQAHEETDKMLKAYEKGDMETIQKIGHLLKGTASNLRITPLADTLYEIQFCDDSSKLEKLIKEYWAHFLAFETQFKLTSNKGN